MFRRATSRDLEQIMTIIKSIQKEMKLENNPQWSEESDYPSKAKMLGDIENNELYVFEEENIIKGFMAITKDKGEYLDLLKTSEEPSYILHRLAIKKEYRELGLATQFFLYAEKLAKENKIKILKGDTERKNLKMNRLFEKLGFVKKGEFTYDDYPGHYIYYEKEIK